MTLRIIRIQIKASSKCWHKTWTVTDLENKRYSRTNLETMTIHFRRTLQNDNLKYATPLWSFDRVPSNQVSVPCHGPDGWCTHHVVGPRVPIDPSTPNSNTSLSSSTPNTCPQKALTECCWSQVTGAQSPIADTPCVWKLFFGSFQLLVKMHSTWRPMVPIDPSTLYSY